jgi:hypothetical protein
VSNEATHADFMVRDSRQPGHFWADNEVLDVYGAKLGAHGIAVYMAMTRRADNSTGECMLSTRRIAKQVAMSTGGVFNALALIVTLGLARKVLESEHGKPAVYVLADVKALGCSSGEHQCSSGERGVHPVNAQYGKKDFLKTKPIPPTPLFQRGAIKTNHRRRQKHDDFEGCQKHPSSGATESGTCWACYAEQNGYTIPEATT